MKRLLVLSKKAAPGSKKSESDRFTVRQET